MDGIETMALNRLSILGIPRRVVVLCAAIGFVALSVPAAAEYQGPVFGAAPTQAPARIKYIFAVHPLHNPKRLFEVYQPIVDIINGIAQEFELKLEASRDYAAFEKKLFSRKFHFALPNPYQTVTSERYGYRIVGKMGDDDNFRGIIIVRKDSPIARIADLQGASISFPASTALAATMMPKYFLYEHGLDLSKNDLKYVGSQESSMMNVYLGKTMAAGTWPPPWRLFVQRRPSVARDLVVKWQTNPLVNNGLVARDDVPSAHEKIVMETFISLHRGEEGRKILAKMDLSRFEKADSRSFDKVRDFVHKYRQVFSEKP